MNVKRPLAMLIAVAMLMSVLAVGPAAAQDECAIGQQNADNDVADVDLDPNVQAGNVALNVPVLSPGADSDATANSVIYDGNDNFGQQNVADINC